MCTAVSFCTKNHYFGRNLDFDMSFQESVAVTPRNYRFVFRNGKEQDTHFAMIGMAFVMDGYPLYYDAVNEKGLAMAGLLFTGNAVYHKEWKKECDNVASFELIPWILGQCETVMEAKEKLEKICVTADAFKKELPPTPLHWILADKKQTIVVESTKKGLQIYDNPVHVLTNNPPFDFHLTNLNHYMSISAAEPENVFSKKIDLQAGSRGMGSIGLPGDYSSISRFVRAAFVRANSVCAESEEESVSQFFHILGSVEMPRGCIEIGDHYDITLYASCCNTDLGIYYYRTYDNQQLTAVDMYRENLEGVVVVFYPLNREQGISWVN